MINLQEDIPSLWRSIHTSWLWRMSGIPVFRAEYAAPEAEQDERYLQLGARIDAAPELHGWHRDENGDFVDTGRFLTARLCAPQTDRGATLSLRPRAWVSALALVAALFAFYAVNAVVLTVALMFALVDVDPPGWLIWLSDGPVLGRWWLDVTAATVGLAVLWLESQLLRRLSFRTWRRLLNDTLHRTNFIPATDPSPPTPEPTPTENDHD